jgi:hypothetical protein
VPVIQHELAPVWGTDVAHVGREGIEIDVSMGNGHVLILEGNTYFPRLQ